VFIKTRNKIIYGFRQTHEYIILFYLDDLHFKLLYCVTERASLPKIIYLLISTKFMH